VPGEPGLNPLNWLQRACWMHGLRRGHDSPPEYHQKVTGYEVRVEADQAERPPQVFTAVRIHHVVRGFDIDASAIEQAIRLSEEKYCSVGAMVQKTASFHTTFEIVAEKTEWANQAEQPRTQA